MLRHFCQKSLLITQPSSTIFSRLASATSGQHTVLVVLYEGSILSFLCWKYNCVIVRFDLGGEAGRRNKKILGCVENALGLPEWIKEKNLQDRLKLVITSDKQGANSVAEKTLPQASVVISQPFWPCYLDEERINKAKHLKLAITAGVGSDHVNLEAACKRGFRFLKE